MRTFSAFYSHILCYLLFGAQKFVIACMQACGLCMTLQECRSLEMFLELQQMYNNLQGYYAWRNAENWWDEGKCLPWDKDKNLETLAFCRKIVNHQKLTIGSWQPYICHKHYTLLAEAHFSVFLRAAGGCKTVCTLYHRGRSRVGIFIRPPFEQISHILSL